MELLILKHFHVVLFDVNKITMKYIVFHFTHNVLFLRPSSPENFSAVTQNQSFPPFLLSFFPTKSLVKKAYGGASVLPLSRPILLRG